MRYDRHFEQSEKSQSFRANFDWKDSSLRSEWRTHFECGDVDIILILTTPVQLLGFTSSGQRKWRNQLFQSSIYWGYWMDMLIRNYIEITYPVLRRHFKCGWFISIPVAEVHPFRARKGNLSPPMFCQLADDEDKIGAVFPPEIVQCKSNFTVFLLRSKWNFKGNRKKLSTISFQEKPNFC